MITRFAPSPTGHLHLGHLVNAVLVWHHARAAGGLVRLRIEDHDRERSRAEYERSILDDLEWLGLKPDVPTLEEFRAGSCVGRQSDHLARYITALERLAAAGLVYGCDCSRADVTRRSGLVPFGHEEGRSALARAEARRLRPRGGLASSGREEGGEGVELRYDGFCRDRGLTLRPGVGVRVRLDPGIERFDDLALGPQRQEPHEQCGDLLARDRLGYWTYQFAVTVDDLVDQITHVIRGRDLLSSTGRQIQLARLLGRRLPPRFFHHVLLAGPDGEKLSKSKGDTSLRELRAAGVDPAELLARARQMAGLAT